MPTQTIRVKATATDRRPTRFTYTFPDSLPAACAAFPADADEIVLTLFTQQLRTQVVAFARGLILKGVDAATIQQRLLTWKPEIKKRETRKLQTLQKKIAGMSAAQKRAFLRGLELENGTGK